MCACVCVECVRVRVRVCVELILVSDCRRKLKRVEKGGSEEDDFEDTN